MHLIIQDVYQPTLINWHSNKYIQELHYYPFAVKLDGCFASSNLPNDFSNKVCVPSKTEDLDIHVFDMITGKTVPPNLKEKKQPVKRKFLNLFCFFIN